MGFKTWEEVLSVSPNDLASQPFVLRQVRFPSPIRWLSHSKLLTVKCLISEKHFVQNDK